MKYEDMVSVLEVVYVAEGKWGGVMEEHKNMSVFRSFEDQSRTL